VTWDATRALVLWAALVLAVGCSGGSSAAPEDAPPASTYRDANKELGIDVASATRAKEEARPEPRDKGAPLNFASITVEPAEGLKVGGELTALATLVTGTSGFVEIDYSWYRNGREVAGARNTILSLDRARARKGDVLEAVAEAMDQHGRRAEIRSKKVIVQNSPPVFVSTPRNSHGLDGLVMRAEDPDGDPVSWSLGESPPGVTIDRSGRIRVQRVDLVEAYSGEVVVVASDPDGARAELHIPVEINAAREEVVGKKTLSSDRNRANMTDEEYERVNLENLERIEKMSAEEFKKHAQEQEERAARREKDSR